MKKKTFKKMARQGDVLIERIDELPEKTKPHIDNIVAHGEATGHKHELVGSKLLVTEDGTMYASVKGEEGSTLTHNKHTEISLPEGTYRFTRQVEYDPNGVRRVAD